MTKRKAKPVMVTYAVQWNDGDKWRSDLLSTEFTSRVSASLFAHAEARRSRLRHRVTRVERTVLEVVTP